MTSDAKTEAGRRRGSGKILSIILISYVMIVLDISVVLTGLPQIQRQLGFNSAGLAWVQSAYTLTFGGLLLLGARAGDIFGRRRMFQIGLLVFTIASAAIGASPSATWMLVWRAIQGVGSAILAPATLALLQTNFAEGDERTRAVSYYAAAAGASATVGLIVGGLLAQYVSWRAGFYVNLPVGLGLMLAAQHYIGETPRHAGRFDLAGALTSTLGVGGLVYGFIRSAERGWDGTTTTVLIGATALLAIFVAIERSVRDPILPLRLFAHRVRSGAYAARILYLGAMVGFWFFETLYLQLVAGLSPALTGLAFLPATILHVPLAVAVPRLVKRFRPEHIMVVGMIIGIVGLGWLAQAPAGADYVTAIALPMLLIGASQGLSLSPLTSAGVTGVSERDAGAASGAVNVAHQLGSSVGLAVLVSAAAISTQGLTGSLLAAHRVSNGLQAGVVMLGGSLLIALLTIVRGTPRLSPTIETEEELARIAAEAA